MGGKLIPAQVTRFQDSKGCLWLTLAEAESAEMDYIIAEQVQKQKDSLAEAMYNITDLDFIQIEEALSYIFKHYTLTPRKRT